MPTNEIPANYRRPPAGVVALATDTNPIYYLAYDSRSGATQLYAVYELGSGAERRLSNGSYLQDATKIVDALRTNALRPKPTPIKDQP